MKINSRKSFICAIKSTKLSIKEHLFIKKHRPWGIILFQRNIKNIDQAKILTSSIRKLFDDPYYPILIDEEGGRVSRLKKFDVFNNLEAEKGIELDTTKVILDEDDYYEYRLYSKAAKIF